LEPWERVWIDAELYQEDIHSLINCTDCHLGESVNDMEAAHEGMVESPTDDPQRTCGNCHPALTDAAVNSLHFTLAGYDTTVYERSIPENHPIIEEMQEYHCNECHATCGDCHISQPASVGGGLIEGHAFQREPSMSRNCTACHGSRVKDEYYGAHEGISSDVHFQARMACIDCHTGDEMHGVGMTATHRYDGAPEPACIDCHQEQAGIGSGIPQHEIHGTETVSCQVCHSTTYTSCVNCHVERTDEDVPFYSVEDHSLGFFIGRNVLQSSDRPWGWTPVRQVPIDINSFSFYGDDLMPNFQARPTWTYATPHNIQRNTPQTASCNACHGNDEVFLTPDNVAEFEHPANANVMVDAAPPLPEGYENVVTNPEDAAPAESGADDGGFWGASDSSDPAEAETEDSGEAGDFWGGDDESEETPADDGSDFWGG
jgi:thiosulfate/3-mercaptopyruvate sulfurtransferase